ncbi:histidinol-phosphatase [soil metagenome]
MASPPADRRLLDDAVELARAAGALTLDWFRRADLVVDRKGDGTPVTEADRGAERLLRAELADRYPDDAVVGEEEDDTPGTSGRRWILDPIDGTKAFTHGVPLYSNLVAVHDEHGPAVGVINLPALGETVYAGRGLGCFCDDRPTRVSDRTEPAGSYLTTSGLASWAWDHLRVVQQAGLTVRTWGDGYGYALVATGRVEVMVDPVAALWDVAAMPVILSEAGGRFSALDGEPGADRGNGLATNGHLHATMLDLLGGA